MIGLNFSDIVKNYKVDRNAPLPTGKYADPWGNREDVDLATYESKYPKSLFNKGVRLENEDHVGHVMKEADDKIVIFGEHDYRFDVPKSKITFVGRNVILGMDWDELFKYKVDKDTPLPSGESVDNLAQKRRMFFTGCIPSETNDTSDVQDTQAKFLTLLKYLLVYWIMG